MFVPTVLLILWQFYYSAMAAEVDAVSQPALVVLIDDMGDNLTKGRAAVELPGPVTYAVLPHSPHGDVLARLAVKDGKEIMLHAPMENTHDRPLGPGALTRALTRAEFVKVLKDDLDTVPGVLGLNNHMGSLLTRLRPQMEWVMEVVRQRQLFFVDSRTTSDSVAWKVAREQGIPYLRRDIFLDHEATTAFVDKQFKKAISIARKEGSAVAIGHPYPVTVAYLKKALPKLDEMGIRLVTASALIEEKSVKRQLQEYYKRQKQRAMQFSSVSPCEPSESCLPLK